MSEVAARDNLVFEVGRIKKTVKNLQQELSQIKERLNDTFLSADDKKCIEVTLACEKKRKLKSFRQTFN